MKSRRRNVSEDPQLNRRRSSRLSADELLLNIPIDLIINIFSRLPLKSIGRCRCVSKRWASVLRRPDFTELFLTKSLARPQLLFPCLKANEVVFFSSPQPQNPVENLSTNVATIDHHMTFPFERVDYISRSSVYGYVCISNYKRSKARKTSELVYVICNPSTRQCLTLPRFKKGKISYMRSFLGYDPIEKQHKVLAMFWQTNEAVEEHKVLTLSGNGKMTWRLIECGVQHSFPSPECVCINGVLYYTAEAFNGDNMIVCFDVRSEKFSFVNIMERGMLGATLINFQGKLASIKSPVLYYLIDPNATFEMWILEDSEKHEWSKRVFNLPPTCKDVVGQKVLHFVGVTAANEIVFSYNSSSDLYYVYYYNFDKEIITRVDIQGMGARERGFNVLTYLDHVQDVKLM